MHRFSLYCGERVIDVLDGDTGYPHICRTREFENLA